MTAQIVTIAEDYVSEQYTEKLVSFDWACTEAGVVSSVTLNKYHGVLGRFEMIPDGGGDTPTAAYTATLKNDAGVDLLGGLGVGSATATATVAKQYGDGLGIIIDSKLTLAIAAAGNAKKGVFNAYIVT